MIATILSFLKRKCHPLLQRYLMLRRKTARVLTANRPNRTKRRHLMTSTQLFQKSRRITATMPTARRTKFRNLDNQDKPSSWITSSFYSLQDSIYTSNFFTSCLQPLKDPRSVGLQVGVAHLKIKYNIYPNRGQETFSDLALRCRFFSSIWWFENF